MFKSVKNINSVQETDSSNAQGQSEKLMDELKNIFRILEIQIKPEDNFLSLFKIVEAKFEQYLIQSKMIKSELPQFFVKCKREIHMTEKQDPFLLKDYLKKLERKDRLHKVLSQARSANQSKLLRPTLPKVMLDFQSSKKAIALSHDSTKENEYFFTWIWKSYTVFSWY